jgi:DNA-binding response OmpR family regulator
VLPQAKPLVLIADDDEQIRHVLSVRLRQADFNVVETRNVQQAKVAFDDRLPDAAILDVQLPDGDGFSICEYIRAAGSDIPVFFLTGAETGIIRNNLPALTKAVGGNHFVRKPFDGKLLTLLLREAVSRPSCTPFG